jgi:hypothetical protein
MDYPARLNLMTLAKELEYNQFSDWRLMYLYHLNFFQYRKALVMVCWSFWQQTSPDGPICAD